MPESVTLINDFAVGEISESLGARIPMAGARIENFVLTDTGQMVVRNGIRQLEPTIIDSQTRIFSVQFSRDNAAILRFAPDGLTVVEIPSGNVVSVAGTYPYTANDLPNIRIQQVGFSIFVASHPAPPAAIVRAAAGSWSISEYETTDGPFAPTRIVDNRELTQDASSPSTARLSASGATLTALGSENRIFNQGRDVGRLVCITAARVDEIEDHEGFNAEEVFSVSGSGDERNIEVRSKITTTNTGTSFGVLYRSKDSAANFVEWERVPGNFAEVGEGLNEETSQTYNDGFDGEEWFYQVRVEHVPNPPAVIPGTPGTPEEPEVAEIRGSATGTLTFPALDHRAQEVVLTPRQTTGVNQQQSGDGVNLGAPHLNGAIGSGPFRVTWSNVNASVRSRITYILTAERNYGGNIPNQIRFTRDYGPFSGSGSRSLPGFRFSISGVNLTGTEWFYRLEHETFWEGPVIRPFRRRIPGTDAIPPTPRGVENITTVRSFLPGASFTRTIEPYQVCGRIDGYIAPNQVRVRWFGDNVIVPNQSTLDWKLGAWFNGNYPQAVASTQGRLIWGASNALYFSALRGSLYDFFESGEANDNEAIIATIGFGSVDAINWIHTTPTGSRIVVGTADAILECRTTSFGEAFTPRNTNIDHLFTEGTAPIAPVRLNRDLYFVHSSEGRVQKLTTNDRGAFITLDITALNENICQDGVKSLFVIHHPDPTLFCVLNDGEIRTALLQDTRVGWARWVSGIGTFNDGCSVRTRNGDVIYFSMRIENGESHMHVVDQQAEEEINSLFVSSRTDITNSRGTSLYKRRKISRMSYMGRGNVRTGTMRANIDEDGNLVIDDIKEIKPSTEANTKMKSSNSNYSQDERITLVATGAAEVGAIIAAVDHNEGNN